MPRPKKNLPDKTRAFSDAFPPHPRQAAFLASAVKLLANTVASAATPDAPVTDDEAMASARMEFDSGLVALIFAPEEGHFHAVWRSASWARLLKPFVTAAWNSELGAYGRHDPANHEPKRKISNHNH